jgi:hypothetical protein
MSHADAIILSNFPPELKPIVRIIDDWVSNRPLALVFEAKIGKGKIIVSGANLVNDLENRSEARQLRASLLNYMNKDIFIPATELSINDIQKIIRP